MSSDVPDDWRVTADPAGASYELRYNTATGTRYRIRVVETPDDGWQVLFLTTTPSRLTHEYRVTTAERPAAARETANAFAAAVTAALGRRLTPAEPQPAEVDALLDAFRDDTPRHERLARAIIERCRRRYQELVAALQ